MKYKGVYTALVTPFKNGAVDYTAFERLLERQIEAGVQGVVPLGSTGEAATLNTEERAEVIRRTVKLAGGKITVVVGTGSNSTAISIENSRIAADLGADAVMLMTPPYNKPSQAGIYAHFEAVKNAVDVPIFGYNIPGRSVVNMTPETIKRLADDGLIVAVKEASGNLLQVMEVLRLCGEKIDILSGDDFFLYPYLELGASGIICTCSNLIPERTLTIYENWCEGDHVAARDVQMELLPLMQTLFIDTNPVPIKAALAELGLCEVEVRLPLVQLQPEALEKLRACMHRYGLIN